MNKINVFFGSDKEFENYVTSLESVLVSNLRDLLDALESKRIEQKQKDSNFRAKEFECIAISTDEYGALKEWAMNSISSVLNNNLVITKRLYLCNPPNNVIKDLKRKYNDIIESKHMEYPKIDNQKLQMIYKACIDKVIGQDMGIKKLLTWMYSLKYQDKPVVLLINGKSGVGKTETAKIICDSLNTELTRIQFSMYQNNEAYNYMFGGDNSKRSFARDLIRREANVIHIDEFDKVNSAFFNVFYQMFDEGLLTDNNYNVDLSNTIFLCTSNFENVKDIKKQLGEPLYSRFDSVIEFELLSKENRKKIAKTTYDTIVTGLGLEDQQLMNIDEVLPVIDKYIDKDNYKNIRTLKKDVQLLINSVLIGKHNILGETLSINSNVAR